MISRRKDTQVFRFRRILRCDFACGCPFFAPCGTFRPCRCDFCRPAARRCTFCIFFVHLHDISTGMSEQDNIIKEIEGREYKYGFTSDIETETIPRGLSEEVVRLISAKKGEPEWMTESRLRAYRHWLTMEPPTWAAPPHSGDRFPGHHLLRCAQGAVPNWAPWTRSTPNSNARSTSWASPWRSRCSWRAWPSMPSWTPCRSRPLSRRRSPRRESSSVRSRRRSATIPSLIKKYLGSVVPCTDNFYAALNAAVFSDGSFCYIPKGVRCPMELSTYFRINAAGYGTVRTHADRRRRRGLRELSGRVYRPAARREPVARRRGGDRRRARRRGEILDRPELVSGRQGGARRHLQLRHQARHCAARTPACRGRRSRPARRSRGNIPSCVLLGDNSVGEFYSVAMTNHFQQADTGTKMIHIGRNTRSRIVSKGISAGRSENSYRGLVKVAQQRGGGAQLFAVRLAADRLRMRGAYLSRDCVQQPHG